MKLDKDRPVKFRLGLVWLGIILLGCFWLTMNGASDPVTMTVLPQAPRQGEPLMATFKIDNPSSQSAVIGYQFYANNVLLKEGEASIPAGSSKTDKYVYGNPLQMGEQVNFMVRTQTPSGSYEKSVSSPYYPPQLWSSFVSFASFSTSVMGSMSTMTYYGSTFGNDTQANAGIVIAMVLIALLVFAEITQPVLTAGSGGTVTSLRKRFSTVTWIVLIIFTGIVFTKVVMVLAG